MKAWERFLITAAALSMLAACGGGGNGKTHQVQPPDPPATPVVTVEADIKQLIFSWDAIAGATHYRLLDNPDGHSGFTQVGDDIPAGTLSATKHVAVHLHNWEHALYMVQACNGEGCAGSTEVSAMNVMLDTIGYFKASNTGQWDEFGTAIAISGDGLTLAIGAPREESAATGIDKDQSDNSVPYAGAVYLFRREGSSWAQQAYIKASNTGGGGGFGTEVSLSDDGSTLAVGAPFEDSGATGINGDQSDNSAPHAGAVYVFHFDGVHWLQKAYVKASNAEQEDHFGEAVVLSADGKTLAVAASLEDSSATGVNGDQSDNQTLNKGALYLFRYGDTNWVQRAYLKASSPGSGGLGKAIAISADGNTLAAGTSIYRGITHVFRFDGTNWFEQAYVVGPGESLAISADGNTLAVGDSHWRRDSNSYWSGAVYLYRFDGTEWSEEALIEASNRRSDHLFGTDVALSADGDMLAVGASRDRSGATGINGDEHDDSAHYSGAAYLFVFDEADWRQHAFVKASNTGRLDNYGAALAMSSDGTTLAVGAPLEDGLATGVNGELNNGEENPGAVYVY